MTISNGASATEDRGLLLFFAIAYLAQGLSCAQFGLIAQPIQFFMMKGLSLNAAQVSSYMAIMMIPWVAKPLYGLLCDFVPLFGYRRKSYLMVANIATAIAFTVMCMFSSLQVMLVALFCTATTMAVATCLMVGLAVEQGRSGSNARFYFCLQEICYYSANMVAAVVGGLLCQHLLPHTAFRSAAIICVLPPLAVSICAGVLITESKAQLNLSGLQETWGALKKSVLFENIVGGGAFFHQLEFHTSTRSSVILFSVEDSGFFAIEHRATLSLECCRHADSCFALFSNHPKQVG